MIWTLSHFYLPESTPKMMGLDKMTIKDFERYSFMICALLSSVAGWNTVKTASVL